MNAVLAPEAPAPIGHNSPPVERTPFDTIRAHMDDLLVEAHAWADGTTVESQAQADEASRLIDELRKAGDVADEKRGEEKAPLDLQIEEIQTRYNEYIAGLKAKHSKPGKVTRAITALKAVVKPYLDQLEEERLAAAAQAYQEAEEAARLAREAVQSAPASDLAALEAAEDLVQAAQHAAATAKQVEKAKPQARGGSRAMSLRKTYTAEITDARECLKHYWVHDRDAIVACLLVLAQQDVDRKVMTIPGVTVAEGTKL